MPKAAIADFLTNRRERTPRQARVWRRSIPTMKSGPAASRISGAGSARSRSSVKDVYAASTTRRGPSCSSNPWLARGGTPGADSCAEDSAWNVPEPELTRHQTRGGRIVGYTVGTPVFPRHRRRDPLYLPRRRSRRSCALGPGITLEEPKRLRDLPIQLTLMRPARLAFEGAIRTFARSGGRSRKLVNYLYRELAVPSRGVFS